jgi:hypothetical protein
VGSGQEDVFVSKPRYQAGTDARFEVQRGTTKQRNDSQPIFIVSKRRIFLRPYVSSTCSIA